MKPLWRDQIHHGAILPCNKSMRWFQQQQPQFKAVLWSLQVPPCEAQSEEGHRQLSPLWGHFHPRLNTSKCVKCQKKAPLLSCQMLTASRSIKRLPSATSLVSLIQRWNRRSPACPVEWIRLDAPLSELEGRRWPRETINWNDCCLPGHWEMLSGAFESKSGGSTTRTWNNLSRCFCLDRDLFPNLHDHLFDMSV